MAEAVILSLMQKLNKYQEERTDTVYQYEIDVMEMEIKVMREIVDIVREKKFGEESVGNSCIHLMSAAEIAYKNNRSRFIIILQVEHVKHNGTKSYLLCCFLLRLNPAS